GRTEDGLLSHSCSFIEFDERGDYLDFHQHRHAYQKILELAKSQQPLTVVIYVHGWRHDGQSHDVIAFNEFLRQLADAPAEKRRVHGVYLAWRGATLRHVIPDDAAARAMKRCFSAEIIDMKMRARISFLTGFLESFSYFDRKSVPEYKFSGTSLSRSIFSCAYAARRSGRDRQVLLMGHSFGGLMLERTFQNAAISQLTAAWPWGEPSRAGQNINPTPFDTVLI